MTSGPTKDKDVSDRATGEARREARLADALRANLKRRKEQARARGAGDTGGHQPEQPTDSPPEKL